MKKRLAFLFVAAMLLSSVAGCQAWHDAMKSAEDAIKTPPEAVVDGAKLGLDFVLGVLEVFLKGIFSGLLGSLGL